jgi:serine/threonine protein kinase
VFLEMQNVDLIIFQKLKLEKPDLIGTGVFGRVYKAYSKEITKVGKVIEKICCVKIIPADKFRESEYNASERLKQKEYNDNVLIYLRMERFDEERLVVLVMDFMNGGDLKDYINKDNKLFSSRKIFEIVKQISLLTNNILFFV